MFRACVGASRGLRWGIVALSAAVMVVAVGSDPADARSRRRGKPSYSKQQSYSPPYAAIVVDANSGRVLHASNPDSQRHPASITKVMTLYLLFEQLEAGRLRLESQLPVSAHAASQAPSKLNLRPGQTIAVEDAIKALVTKSANDVAVVVAEAIGGDEDGFAAMMTRKARALGMSRTVYANASGLPNDEQITTARDQSLLGRAIQDRFPHYYRYFATSSFFYKGHPIRNHNRLLGRVAGVDGIKTGFIRASGFNLLTSVRRGNRHLVAVVLGGTSGGARDARMRALIEEYVAQGATERTIAKITEGQTAVARAKPLTVPVLGIQLPSAADGAGNPPDPARMDTTASTGAMQAAPRPGSNEPIAAVPVKTLTVRAANSIQNAAMAALSMAAAGAGQVPAAAAAPPPAPAAVAAPPPAPPAAAPAPSAPTYRTASAQSVPATLMPSRTAVTAPAAVAAAPAPEQPAQMASLSSAPKVTARSGWIIQIGAFPDENEARERLQSAQNIGKDVLGRADPFTERVVRGNETLYRARFAGLDERRAEAACKHFKRNKIDCFTVKH
jgi:D-alanyl-D-alanine carboxypeptidase